MAARECAEMKEALRLVAQGMSKSEAARWTGVSRRGLQNAVQRKEKREAQNVGARTEGTKD
jgi:predicted DNA-binding protein (UPF0251 family)